MSPSDAAFEKVSGTKVWSGRVSLVRRKFGPNVIALLRELQTQLALKKAKHRPEDARKVAHLSVKIVYRETPAQLAKRSLKDVAGIFIVTVRRNSSTQANIAAFERFSCMRLTHLVREKRNFF